ncbi:MAG: RDD family protein [Planctomycetota bacterium]
MLSNTNQTDTTIEVIAPENIAFIYRVAGPFRRFPAYLLDVLFRGAALLGLAMLLSIFSVAVGSLATAIWILVLFLTSWFYGGLFEAYWNGQTPGKRIMGMRVLSTNGRPINGYQAILRNLLRTVDIYFAGIGVVVMACNGRLQRLGDLACGTMVVIEERPWLSGIAKLDDPRVYQLASYLPSDLKVSRSMALALAHYAERRRFFSAPRRREVAAHVARPLLKRYGLPADTSFDLLLCTMYYRLFIADRGKDEMHAARAGATGGRFSPRPWSRPNATGQGINLSGQQQLR